MPNFCETDIFLSGSDSDIDRLVKWIGLTENQHSDINLCDKILPYPDEFAKLDADFPFYNDPDFCEKRKAYATKWGTDQRGYDLGGFEWCIENWGVKWGTKPIIYISNVFGQVIKFKTPDNPPKQKLFIELHKLFPEISFHLESYNKGDGTCGGYTIPSQEDYDEPELWQPGLITYSWSGVYKGNRGG